MRGGASRLRGSLLVLGTLLPGCATTLSPPPAIRDALPPDRAAEVVERWDAEWRAFAGLRGLVEVTLSRRDRAQRTSGVLLLSPSHLRFEAVAPFGLTTLIVTAGPEGVLVWNVIERRAWMARPSPAALTRWIGVSLPVDTLIRVLAGQVPLPETPGTLRPVSDRGPHLAFERGGVSHRVWITSEGLPARLDLSGEEPLAVTFERVSGGALDGVRVEAPARTLSFQVRYLAAEPLAPPADFFNVALPAGTVLERLD